MRPLKLTMQAFGPYADRTDVDLEQLGGRGLYLVTGDTGAGKTTIFDGICYALFGKASGDSRAVNMFRSEYAADDVITLVELIFEYGETKYRVHREPKQMTLKKRGEGLTKLNPVNELYIVGNDKPIASNESEVNQKIKDILRLDHEQYRNVAMIAQGSFAQLLNTKTDSRTKILSAIFSTGKYAMLQERLREDLSQINRRYEESNLIIKSLLGSIKLSGENPYKPMIDEAAAYAEAAADTDAEDICIKAREHEQMLAKLAVDGFDMADKQHKAAALALEKGRALQELFDRLRLTEENLKKLVPALSESEDNAKRLNERKPELNGLIGQIAADTDKLSQYDDAEALMKEALELSVAAQNALKQTNAISTALEMDEKRLNELKKLVADIGDIGALLAESTHSIEKHQEQLASIKSLAKEISEAEKLKAAENAALETLKYKKSDYDKLEAEHSQLFSLYIAEQAGILADALSDGAPCPVCGSTDHPHKAHKSEKAPDKKQVDAAKLTLDRARDALERASSDHAAAKAARESAVASLIKHAGVYAENCTPEQMLQNVQKEQNTVSAALAEETKRREQLSLKANQKSAAEKEVVDIEKRILQNRERFTAVKSEQTGLAAKAEEKTKAAKKQLSELAYPSRVEAEKQINVLKNQRSSLEKAMADADKRLTELRKMHTELTGKLGELKEQTKDTAAPNCDALLAAEQESAKAVKEALVRRDEANTCLASIEGALKKLQPEMENNRKLQQEYGIKSVLNSTANGTLAKKQHVSLETYVQMEYFERILAHANVRLLQMTNGQYELIRSVNNRGTSKVGLDIDVIDHFTSSVRSIGSLSGGESFIASLALALGFSDQIQQTSGGVRIDSMFVDEGFGSLDSGILDLAINTLQSLAGNDRLVGVISHVPEMKDRLDKMIIVTKNKTVGSNVQIVKKV